MINDWKWIGEDEQTAKAMLPKMEDMMAGAEEQDEVE